MAGATVLTFQNRRLRFEKLSDFDIQCIGKNFNRIERGIRSTTFYAAHIASSKATAVGKRLLRHATRQPQFLHSFAKLLS